MAVFACCREIHKLKVHCKCVEAINKTEAEQKLKAIEDKEKNKPAQVTAESENKLLLAMQSKLQDLMGDTINQ